MTSRHTVRELCQACNGEHVYEYIQLSPISAISLIVCLIAQTIESINSLNRSEGRVSRASILQYISFENVRDKRTGEAVQVDCTQELEEADAMLRELRKVLINHIQGRLEYSLHNCRNLRREEIL